jgi:DNA-binding MarR family transcriptional regulator
MDEVAASLESSRTMATRETADTTATDEHHDAYECARAWVALRQVHARVNEALTTALAREFGLTINDFEVLVYLQSVAPDAARPGDLSGVVSLSQPAISRLVARLEQQGLVQRNEATDDRRSVLIALTDAGRTTLERAAPVHADCIRGLLTSRLTDAEQETLVKIFARVQARPDE